MKTFKKFIIENKSDFSKDNVYYHGTASNIKSPTMDHFGKTDMGRWGKATYWTDIKDYAQGYGKKVISAKLDLNDPLIIKTKKEFDEWHKKLVNALDARKINDMPQNKRMEALGNLLRDKLKMRGYDSVVDYSDNNLRAREYGKVATIAVFNDEDIKIIKTKQNNDKL